MAGGERKRPRESRFADKKRPPNEQRKTALELRAERLQVPPCFVSNEEMVFCPFHGRKLEGESLKCPTCWRGYLDRRVVYTPGSLIAVDHRMWVKHWRRILFRRMRRPFHSHVRYLSEPHVDVQVIWQVRRQDKDGSSYSMPSGSETNAKVLETTWAVEDFCSFGAFESGFLSAKLTESGDILMIVPLVEVAHVKSNVTGQRCRIEFGWVQLTSKGTFNKAENMPDLAQGWKHVEARARDIAAGMLAFQNGIDGEMVARSKAILRAKYSSDEEFLSARQAREDNRPNILPPPVPTLAEREASMLAKQVKRQEKACQVARFYGEDPAWWNQVERGINPYEAYKNKPRPGKATVLCTHSALHCHMLGLHCIVHCLVHVADALQRKSRMPGFLFVFCLLHFAFCTCKDV
jgi:hypothetical protein